MSYNIMSVIKMSPTYSWLPGQHFVEHMAGDFKLPPHIQNNIGASVIGW